MASPAQHTGIHAPIHRHRNFLHRKATQTNGMTMTTNHDYTFDSRGRLDTTTGADTAGTYTFDNFNHRTGALGATYILDAAGQFTDSTTPAGSSYGEPVDTTPVSVHNDGPEEIMSTARVGAITIHGRNLEIRESTRGWIRQGFDIIDVTGPDEVLLTVADPWTPEPPTTLELISFLSERKQRLIALMAEYKIVAGVDYPYEAIYRVVQGSEPVGRWVAIHGDETYHQVHVTETVQAALDHLAAIDGDNECGNIVGVYDLDTDTLLRTRVTVTLADESAALDSELSFDNSDPNLIPADSPVLLTQLDALIDAGLTFAHAVQVFAARRGDHPTDAAIIEAARDIWHKEGSLEVDDTTIIAGSTDRGDYVMMWGWVSNAAAGVRDCEECGATASVLGPMKSTDHEEPCSQAQHHDNDDCAKYDIGYQVHANGATDITTDVENLQPGDTYQDPARDGDSHWSTVETITRVDDPSGTDQIHIHSDRDNDDDAGRCTADGDAHTTRIHRYQEPDPPGSPQPASNTGELK
jgi:hypothetical protein